MRTYTHTHSNDTLKHIHRHAHVHTHTHTHVDIQYSFSQVRVPEIYGIYNNSRSNGACWVCLYMYECTYVMLFQVCWPVFRHWTCVWMFEYMPTHNVLNAFCQEIQATPEFMFILCQCCTCVQKVHVMLWQSLCIHYDYECYHALTSD